MMFRHLLVPLDGSPLAEAAMPAVRHLAAKLGARVTLLHMIERNAPREIHGQSHLSTVKEAEQYLSQLTERDLPGLPTLQCHVHRSAINDVSESIVDHAKELGSELIVLCTHGAGGLRHGLFGNVAQRVIALGTTPVLLIPSPQGDDGPRFSCRRLLLPLDGDSEHEQGLLVVENLGAGCGEQVRLLMVIPTWRDLKQTHLITSRMLPGTTVELLDATNDPAQDYLNDKMAEMENTGEVTASVVRGEPVSAIVAAAREFQADLIVLGTHGTSHLEAFWSGSVTPQLSKNAHFPILLVPIHDAAPLRSA